MAAIIAAVTALGVTGSPLVGAPPTGVTLEYRRPLGQVAVYRLSLEATGEQLSLGERLPIRWRGEVEHREEVIALARGGVIWLRARASPVAVSEGANAGIGAMLVSWPALEFRISPRGELLDVSLATGDVRPGPRTRAFASLAAQPGPVVLPAHPVEIGAKWVWEREGSRQANRLVDLDGEGEWRVARIASTAHVPLDFSEQSEALGLSTHLEGSIAQRSRMDLLVSRGLPLRHQGEMDVRTDSRVALALAGGGETFAISSTIRVAFDLRLVSIDGNPVEVG